MDRSCWSSICALEMTVSAWGMFRMSVGVLVAVAGRLHAISDTFAGDDDLRGARGRIVVCGVGGISGGCAAGERRGERKTGGPLGPLWTGFRPLYCY